MNIDNKAFNIMVSEAAGPMEYSGTLPLDLDEFPLVPSPQELIDQGLAEPGDSSNIVTRQYGVDGKTWLLPTMRKGKMLTKDQINDMIKNREHFGVFNTKAEADWMDKQIHGDFKKLYGK